MIAQEHDHGRPSVLRLLLEIPVTNAPYQALSLPLATRHKITLCTYFPAATDVHPEIRLFEGDGTLRGFVRVLLAALRCGSYDVVHAHTPHVAVVFLALSVFQPKLLRSTIFTVHSCYENHKQRNKIMLLPTFAMFKRIVCCSRSSFESFPRVYRWLAGRRMRFVQNGVHTSRIGAVRDRLNGTPPESCFTVVSVGRLVPIKNLGTTIGAFAKIAGGDSRLVFVGDGPMRAPLAEQSQRLGLNGSVCFTGLLMREEVYRRMLQSDLYISTSRGEGLPVAVLEAMACGCPVVLSDIAPHREIADGADFIPLVDPADVDGFAREVDRFRQMPPEQRRGIGAQCARLVHDRFSLDAMHSGYERIFNELATERRR